MKYATEKDVVGFLKKLKNGLIQQMPTGGGGGGGSGSGDMLKSVYDQNNNGVVDNSEKLGGNAPSAFAQASHTHTEGDLSLSDVTTGDVSTSRHGFCPKAPNDTTKFLRADGTWAVPPLGGSFGVSYMFPPKLISDVYFCPFNFTAVAAQALMANRIYVAPFILGRDLTITTIAIQVTTAGSSGSVAQVGIYSNGSDNAPGSLLYDTIDLDTSSTGMKTYSPYQSWQLQAGTVYWMAVQGSAAPTLRAIALAMGLVYLSGTTGVFTSSYFYSAPGYGFPSSLAGVTWNYQSSFPAAFFGY
jgi:hypothetical protein